MKRNKMSAVLAILLMLSGALFVTVPNARAASPPVAGAVVANVLASGGVPSYSGNGPFTAYPYNPLKNITGLSPGYTFWVYVDVINVTQLFLYQVGFKFNTTVLQIINCTGPGTFTQVHHGGKKYPTTNFFLSAAGPTVANATKILTSESVNVTGIVRFEGFYCTDPTGAENGSGPLLAVCFCVNPAFTAGFTGKFPGSLVSMMNFSVSETDIQLICVWIDSSTKITPPQSGCYNGTVLEQVHVQVPAAAVVANVLPSGGTDAYSGNGPYLAYRFETLEDVTGQRAGYYFWVYVDVINVTQLFLYQVGFKFNQAVLQIINCTGPGMYTQVHHGPRNYALGPFFLSAASPVFANATKILTTANSNVTGIVPFEGFYCTDPTGAENGSGPLLAVCFCVNPAFTAGFTGKFPGSLVSMMNFSISEADIQLICVATDSKTKINPPQSGCYNGTVLKQAASVYLNPFRVSGVAGQIVNATLEISNITNFFRFQAGCTFNPLVAHCIEVFDGGFLGSLGGTEIVTSGSIDNVQGTVSPYSFALTNTAKAPSGSGPLMIFEFQMVVTGCSDVHVIDWIPVGTDGNEIPTKTVDHFTISKGVVQIAGNPEGSAMTPPYEGFNALEVQAVSTSVNGVAYNGNMSFTMYSPDANSPNNHNYGFLNVSIPKSLMTCNASSQWYLSLNGDTQSLRVVSEDATDTFISLGFTYSVTGLEQVQILSVYYWSIGQYRTAISTTGKNIKVSPATCAQVTFTNITTTGVLTMNITQPSSNATALTSSKSSVFVALQTNATYHGNVTLQFKYNPAGLSLEDQKAMRMWLWNATSNAWRDITTHVNTTENTVYGVSPHLSQLALSCTPTCCGSDGQQISINVQTPSSPPAGLPTDPSLLALAYYDIQAQATAQYKSPFTVRLAYDASTISPQQALFLQMWLWNTTLTKWVEIPTRVDIANNVVYGVSPHLSCFGITSLQPFPLGIAMVGAACSKTIVGKGYNVTINVSIKNLGANTQSFMFFVYANTTAIYSKQISLLPLGQTGVALNFTANLAYGNYSIGACDQPIGWVRVSIPGDDNGDGVVNILDVGVIAAHWLQPVPLSAPPKLANADVNGDGIVNIMDVGVIAVHWLQTIP